MRSPGRPPVARREDRQRVLEGDRPGAVERGRRRGLWCHRRWAAGGSAKVAACHRSVWLRRRDATCRSPSARRSPSCKAQQLGVRQIARRLGRSAVDDLPGAAPQRRDPRRPAGVSSHDGAVACRPACQAPEAGQARRQRRAARVRAGPACRRGRRARRHGGARSEGSRGSGAARPPQGPALGQVVESGADRQPAAGRLPR